MISKQSNLIKELSSSSQPVLVISENFDENLMQEVISNLKIYPEQLVDFDPTEGVQQLRLKIATLYLKPLNLNKKLFLISHSEKLNTEEVNTILKLLEEPPSYLRTLLVSSSLSSVIMTVRSRCKVIILDSTKINYDRDRTIIDLLKEPFSSYIDEIKKVDRDQFCDLLVWGIEESRKKLLNKDEFLLFKNLVKLLSKIKNTNVNHLLIAEGLYIKNRSLKQQ